MSYLGYAGYLILVILALTWTFGVRVKLAVGIPVIMSAMFFVISSIVLAVAPLSKLHSLWLIPVGYIFNFIVLGIMIARIPILVPFLRFLASCFAGLVRLGIPAEQIRKAQYTDFERTFADFERKHR